MNVSMIYKIDSLGSKRNTFTIQTFLWSGLPEDKKYAIELYKKAVEYKHPASQRALLRLLNQELTNGESLGTVGRVV